MQLVAQENYSEGLEGRNTPGLRTFNQAGVANILKTISIPGVFLINSKSQGGKSHLLHWVFYENKDKFAWGVVFSNTAFNEENLPYVDRRFKHLRYNQQVLRNLLEEQIKIPKKSRPLVFIIFDDCLSDFHQEDKVLLEAITQTFHYNIFICITTQSINKVLNFGRENAFQVALFKLFSKGQVEAAYDSYGQDFDTVKEFKENVNKKLGKHVFAFLDRHNADMSGIWLFLKCPPPPLPAFKLRSGLPEEPENKKRKATSEPKGKKRKEKKRRKKYYQEPSVQDIADHLGIRSPFDY